MQSKATKLSITRAFQLVGAVVLAIGLFGLIGCLLCGVSPVYSALCVLIGGGQYFLAGHDIQKINSAEDCE